MSPDDTKTLGIVEATGKPVTLEAIYRLRVKCWRSQVDLPIAYERWHEPIDDAARHWAFCIDGEVVGAVRLSIHDSLAELPHSEVFEGHLNPEPPIAYAARAVKLRSARIPDFLRHCAVLCADEAKRGGGARSMVALAGSLEGNRGAAVALARAGFQSIGRGNPYRDPIYKTDYAPHILHWPLDAA